VSVHIKGATECFECQPKPTPKTFPVCTIRNTPDKVRRTRRKRTLLHRAPPRCASQLHTRLLLPRAHALRTASLLPALSVAAVVACHRAPLLVLSAQPIHCIVWAKDMLFTTLFGPRGVSDLEEAEPQAGGEEDEAKETAEARRCLRASRTPMPA
jgi:hypothetical protein